MALDPTFSPYVLAVAAASGAVAAGMHWTNVLARDKPPARGVFINELVKSFVVGVAMCAVVQLLPWQVPLIPLLVVAALAGSYLGPRGISWLFLALLGGLRKALPALEQVPDPPAPDVVPSTPTLPKPKEEGNDA